MTGRKFTATTFTITPDWVIDELPAVHRANAAVVWQIIGRYADRRTGEAWPCRETIAKKCGKSRATVARAIDQLEAIGALERCGQRKGKGGAWGSQMYVMHFDPPR